MRRSGIYANIDIEEYHAEEGISSSGITLILDCPKRYHHEFLAPKPPVDPREAKKQKDKYKLGRALHMLALEPGRFNSTFYVMDEEVNLTTKAGKEAYAAAEEAAKGRDIIRAGDWEEIQAMSEAVSDHAVWERVRGGKVEHSIYWEGGIYGTRLRSRPDIFTDELCIDIKTTDSIANFKRSMAAYGYHRQAAMQIDGLHAIDGKTRTFAFFVVEKKAPYLTACFAIDVVSLEQGRQEYQDGATIYTECLDKGVWPGYPEEFQLIALPAYAMIKEDLAA
jgi:hypothetical protein